LGKGKESFRGRSARRAGGGGRLAEWPWWGRGGSEPVIQRWGRFEKALSAFTKVHFQDVGLFKK
jgi:hypothetical protein